MPKAIIGTMIVIWPYYRWVAVAQVPYLIWVSLATVLQLSIAWMNLGEMNMKTVSRTMLVLPLLFLGTFVMAIRA